MMEELRRQVETLLKELAELRAEVVTLRTENAELKSQVAELQLELVRRKKWFCPKVQIEPRTE